MEKRLKTGLLGILALLSLLGVAAIALIVIGSFSHHRPPVRHPLSIKAHGKISQIDAYFVLSTPHGTNNYTIVADKDQADMLKQYAKNNQDIYVFGVLMQANPQKIKDTKILASIDLVKFDAKDFAFTMLSPQETALLVQKEKAKKIEKQTALKEKKVAEEKAMKEKIALRNQILKKVKMNRPDMDVLIGKLKIGNCVKEKGRQSLCLLLQDTQGETYILSNRDGIIKAPVEKFVKFKGLNMEVAVVGRFVIPDNDVIVPLHHNSMTFLIRGLYNYPDLNEFVVE